MNSIKREQFHVSVKVFEASDLPRSNMSTMIAVQVGEEIKYTHVEKNTEVPFFNEFFVFQLNTTFASLMDIVIKLAIFEPRTKYKLKKLVGCLSLDVATVWAHPDHRIKRWLAVTLPSDKTSKDVGFIKSEIIIDAPEEYKTVPQLSPIESPSVLGGVRARYFIRLYHCIGLDVPVTKKEPLGASLAVTFAGRTRNTTKRILSESTEWNEQIVFIELFPPLFQKISVDLCLWKRVLAKKVFYISDINIVSRAGFLPTFGPTYVHLYSSNCDYCASLLMSISTEYVTTFKHLEIFHGNTLSAIPAIHPNQYGAVDSFLIYGVIFDAMLVDKKFENCNLNINFSFGKGGKRPSEYDNISTSTPPFKAKAGRPSLDFVFLPIKDKKPSVFVLSEWPNTRHRLSNTNVLTKLSNNLVEATTRAEELILKKKENEAKHFLNFHLQDFRNKCRKMSGYLSQGVTQFDIERVSFIVKMANEMLEMTNKLNVNDLEMLISVMNKCISVIDVICEDPQDTFPLAIVSLVYGNTVVGCGSLQPKDIIFSKTELKKGNKCGKINGVLLRDVDQNIVGRVDIWLWLGFWNQVSYCLKDLPPGHENITKAVSLPSSIKYLTYEKYALNCYIYCGQVVGGTSYDGLCDLYVKVLVSNQSRNTKTIRKTLVPFWKEIIIFNDIQLYPEPEYIKQSPPSLIVQIWDQSSKPATLIDTVSVLPEVRLHPIVSTKECEFHWVKLGSSAKILSAFELVQTTEEGESGKVRMSKVMPAEVSYRLEVVFWGVRAVNEKGLKGIIRPQIIIQWGSIELSSEVLTRVNISPNFQHNLHVAQIELPEEKLFARPLVLRLFSSSKCIGCEVDTNIDRYILQLPTKKAWMNLITHKKSMIARAQSRHSTTKNVSMPDLIPLIEIDNGRHSSLRPFTESGLESKLIILCRPFQRFFKRIKSYSQAMRSRSFVSLLEEEEEECDWWYKYFVGGMKIYTGELEAQSEFGLFNDVLKTFTINQKYSDTSKPFTKVKAMICLFKWPSDEPVVTMEGNDPEMGVLKQAQFSDKVQVLVRVYCIKAHNLLPADLNNKADPYIEIATPSNVVSDKSNYIMKQLNPIFGRSFEIVAEFPVDSVLTVRVMDWDRFTMHDLIGETTIDLENRFYSKYRGSCGISPTYSAVGYNAWRDIEKPKSILERLCNTYNLPLPQYCEKSVLVASKEFIVNGLTGDDEEKQQKLALSALQRWDEVPIVGHLLVPEHVETRPLFRNDRPGLVQGTLEMWVDMFDMSLGKIPPPLDVTPRSPQPFELRVIIWNTEKVPLVDNSYLVGRKHTDIFVKAWLGDMKSAQTTDVHFTSIDGKGNFNWRFIFQFSYYIPEKKMVVYRKSVFDFGKAEVKIPAYLHIQIWDKDRISPNDFIGSMVLELCRMPRGAKSSKSCKIKKELTPSNTVDLFKAKRLRGWWPFHLKDESKEKLFAAAGCLEAEFELLTADEAKASPAGLGREQPAGLPPPIRPEFRVRFWMAPLRILLHLICGVHKGKLILCCLIFLISIFFMIGLYSIPMFFIKRILGA